MEGLTHYHKEERPWGNFLRFTQNESSTVEVITANPGEAFSLQKHEKRNEFWYVLAGRGKVTVGEGTSSAKAGSSFFIPQGTLHRAEAAPDNQLVLLEIAFGLFDEEDVLRIEDRYGRV